MGKRLRVIWLLLLLLRVCRQRPGFRPGRRVTFWLHPESNQRNDSAESCPAELAARLQRFAQTAAGDWNFLSCPCATLARARGGDVDAVLLMAAIGQNQTFTYHLCTQKRSEGYLL